MAGKIVLVDGHSILNRAFYAIPEMTDSQGRHTNAVYGFLNILFKVLDDEKPQYLAVAFDRKEPTFRHEMYAEYKGTRKGMPEELHEQVPLTKELIKACGVPVMEKPGYEADDILGTIASRAEKEGLDVVILSGDRDLLQLATEKVRICIPKTKKGQTVYENYLADDVKEAYGVTPAEFIELKALMGDSSDNIPGVPGIGEKTGTALIQAYHSVEGVYENLEDVKPPRAKKSLEANRELAELSLKLATICVEAPIELEIKDARFTSLYTAEAYELLKSMGMKTYLRRYDAAAKAGRLRRSGSQAGEDGTAAGGSLYTTAGTSLYTGGAGGSVMGDGSLEPSDVSGSGSGHLGAGGSSSDGNYGAGIMPGGDNCQSGMGGTSGEPVSFDAERASVRILSESDDIQAIFDELGRKLTQTHVNRADDTSVYKSDYKSDDMLDGNSDGAPDGSSDGAPDDSSTCTSLAIQSVTVNGTYLGTALCSEDGVVYIPDSICEAFDLLPVLKKLAECADTLIALDLKAMLKHLPFAEDARWFDVGVAAYLVNPLKHDYGWDDIALGYLGEAFPSKKDIVGKTKPADLGAPELEKLARCSAAVPFAAAKLVKDKLTELEMDKLYREIELPLIFSLDRMEKAGVRVERSALEEYGRSMRDRISELEQDIYEEVGHEFNINSPKQLGEVLFEEMALPGGKKTKTGYSTAADVLEKLAPFVPVINQILEYRTLTKLKSTYADGLQNYIGEDERIHGTFNQTVTATGRISSTEPNLQNIPVRTDLGREIRAMFVPEDGCVLVDADYSQIELRILAAMSGDERLIEAYNEAKDIHAITASQVFHVPLEDITPELRRNAKAVNFGIVYGISSFGLSEGLSISRQEAADYIERYFATYPGVKAYLDGQVRSAKKRGYVETLYGRRRPVPEIKSSNFNMRSFGERVAMNSPIQGTAADIMKIAMIRVDRRLRQEKLRTRIVLQVHDELLLEAPEEEVGLASKILEEEMTGAASLSVPLVVEVHSGKNWMEAK